VGCHPVGHISMRFEHADRLSEMVVLQGPPRLDSQLETGPCPLLHLAFPSSGGDQNGFNGLPLVRISRLQEFFRDPPDRVFGRPSIGFLSRLVPERDDAPPVSDEDHVVGEIEQARLVRKTHCCRLVVQRKPGGDRDGCEAHERAQSWRSNRI